MSTTHAGWLTPWRTAFDNGVVGLAQWNPTSPVVAINATFDAGSVADPADLPGLAYLVRRTIDRGTRYRVSRYDTSQVCSCSGIQRGRVYTRDTLLKAMLLPSGNDAAEDVPLTASITMRCHGTSTSCPASASICSR